MKFLRRLFLGIIGVSVAGLIGVKMRTGQHECKGRTIHHLLKTMEKMRRKMKFQKRFAKIVHRFA